MRRRRLRVLLLASVLLLTWAWVHWRSHDFTSQSKKKALGKKEQALGEVGPIGLEEAKAAKPHRPELIGARTELNALVDASVARTAQQRCNVAFIKTHKTASTTMTSILYRYGARHNKTIARFDVKGTSCTLEKAAEDVSLGKAPRSDIFHYHYVWDGIFKGGEFDYIEHKYRQIMSLDSPMDFVSVLREPIRHYLSYYYFYYEPLKHVQIEEYLKNTAKLLRNPLCAEFGIYGPRQLDRFIKNDLPKFTLMMLTEKFDEGVVLLAHMFGWDLIDVTYSSMLENKEGAVRWDGKPLRKAPKFEELSSEAQQRLKGVVALDWKLYKAAAKRYKAAKAEFARSHGLNLTAEVEKYNVLQDRIRGLLEADTTLEARTWYSPDPDLFFYHTPVLGTGKAPSIPF